MRGGLFLFMCVEHRMQWPKHLWQVRECDCTKRGGKEANKEGRRALTWPPKSLIFSGVSSIKPLRTSTLESKTCRNRSSVLMRYKSGVNRWTPMHNRIPRPQY